MNDRGRFILNTSIHIHITHNPFSKIGYVCCDDATSRCVCGEHGRWKEGYLWLRGIVMDGMFCNIMDGYIDVR